MNEAVVEEPTLINSDAYGGGWLFKIRPADAGAVDKLQSAADYEKANG